MNRSRFPKVAALLLMLMTVANACHNKDSAVPRVDFTVDLNDPNHPEYQNLNATGGTVTFSQYGVLVGHGVNGYFAVSYQCTLHGCALQYQASYDVLQCPCATCQFNTAGGVVMGPASTPLLQYATQLNGQYLRVYTP